MGKISLIIEREYRERVVKKSFIWTTILVPVVMMLLMLIPAAIMIWGGTSRSSVLVVDNSGRILPTLTSTDEISIMPAIDMTVDSALTRTDVDGILIIPSGIVEAKQGAVKYYTNGPTSMNVENELRRQINTSIQTLRLKDYNIDNLNEILDATRSDVTFQNYRNDEDSEKESTSSALSFGLGYALTFILYMFIMLYGQMIMNSIIEEKNNRIMEVVVSSVSPAKMMIGKIIGVGLTAVTQILVWGILLTGVAMLIPALMPADLSADIAAYNAGDVAAISGDAADNIKILQAFSQLSNVGYIVQMGLLLTAFLIGGFLLYAAMFAAVGSSVDNAQDASQLTIVAMLPIIIGLVVGMMACQDPNSGMAFWFSLIPFTSPMVMMARIPFGIPGWEILVSLVVLYLSFLGMVWVAAKIYRVGIFMYGKKPNLKDLARWITYK